MITTLTPTRPKTNRLLSLVIPEAQQMLAVGRQRNWEFQMLGQAPCPTRPVRVGDWLITPIEQDSSRIPARTLERVEAIYAAGLRPKRFVLVHEAPLLLTGPTQSQADNQAAPRPKPSLAPELKTLASIVLAGGAVLAIGALVTTALTAMLVGTAVASLAVDPILVAVTDDDYWIEIDRWWV